jgi:ornithine cyclodeaminase/alanine dehydrogenase-like protein (mu-crystallin family)
MESLPPLLYLAAADVRAAMPPLEERLELAERALVALASGEGELPAKIAVHPRPAGSFVHAMPASLRGPDPSADRLGMKWVAGFPTNGERGLAAIHAVVVLNDPQTGVPTAILDGGPVTAERTAAVSGVIIRRFGPPATGSGRRAAIIGAGVQGNSHLPVLAALLPELDLTVYDRHPERAAALAQRALETPGVRTARVADDARTAIAGADVVVTCASFTTPDRRQVMTVDWLAADALVVPVDYATYCSAQVAREAALFLVDDLGQFLTARAEGHFDGYPDPAMTIGAAIRSGHRRPPGRMVATHLGIGLADVLFGAAIVERARRAGLGMELPR